MSQVYNENREQNLPISGEVKEPRHSETISDEKCHLYRSTRR